MRRSISTDGRPSTSETATADLAKVLIKSAITREKQNWKQAHPIQKHDDDVDMNSINTQKEIKEKADLGNKWWEEYINAIAKGKGKGKGFQGSCYNCGEFGHSIRNCPNESTQTSNKGGKDQSKGSKGSKGGEKGKGKGYQGTCWTCGVVGHFWHNCPPPQNGTNGINPKRNNMNKLNLAINPQRKMNHKTKTI